MTLLAHGGQLQVDSRIGTLLGYKRLPPCLSTRLDEVRVERRYSLPWIH